MEALINELKEHIIEALSLDEITPEEIDAEAPLFGTGLGLDSIDALELAVMVEKFYRIRITDGEVGNQAFSSVKALAKFIQDNSAQ